MKQLMTICAAIVLAGLVLGGVFSLTQVPDTVESDRVWSDPPTQTVDTEAIDTIQRTILASGLLGEDAVALAGATQAEQVEEADAAPGFPQIVATGIIDGSPRVSLRLPDGRIESYMAGAELPGGWTIVEVTLERVAVSQDGRETTLAVFANGEG